MPARIRSVVCALVAGAVMLAPIAGRAETLGVITILEGSASIFRGAGRVFAAEGVRVESGDLVHTAEASMLQLELADSSVAQLGPNTRVMLTSAGARPKPERALYVLNGWVKFITTQRDPKAAATFDVRAPLFELQPTPGVLVFKTSPAETVLFVEAGTMRLAERWGGARGAETELKQGAVYQRKAAGKSQVVTALPADFLAEMPRVYRDALPSRRARFADREVAARAGPDFQYAEVEGWLKAEPAVRRPFVQRWRGKTRDDAFRTALVNNLQAHTEWDPILFPEKYLPKPPPKPTPDFAAETERQTKPR